jgi:hypothetical protein
VGGAVKALSTMIEDELGRAVGIVLDLIVPKSNNGPALLFENLGPSPVVGSGGVSMLASIQLDGQFRFTTGKIDNVRPDYELTCESRPILSQPQPQQPFRFGRMIAKRAGVCSQLLRHSLHDGTVANLAVARTHPLPLPCREG